MDIVTSEIVQGIILGISLIIPIGVQNMYLLRQGAIGKHPYTSATVCTICDCILILVGAAGMGTVIASYWWLRVAGVVSGVAFLAWYGTKSARRALTPRTAEDLDSTTSNLTGSLLTVILTSISISILNPHAILDTTILLGGLAAQRSTFDARMSFALGACIGSIIWFYSLATFSRYLRPLFTNPIAGRILDGAVALVVWYIAAALTWTELAADLIGGN